MRVLAWPMYTMPGNPLADSGYICFRNLIRAVPEWTWHVVVPSWATEERGRSIRDDLDDLPNVVKVPVEMQMLYRTQEAAPCRETLWKYSPQMGDQPVDALITGSNQIAAAAANMWGIRTEEKHRPAIVAWDLLTRDDSNSTWASTDVEHLMHYTGAAVADLNIFGSEMMRYMTAGMLRKLLSPSVMRETLQNKSETVYAGVPVEKILEKARNATKREKFTIFYGGRMGEVKRVDDLTAITDMAFRFGREMDMVVCTGTISPGRKESFTKQFPMVELHTGTGQDETWELMAQCHAGFMWSKHEMIGSMFVEEMVAGLPVIASRHRWLESLLPPEYPYWADGKEQGGLLLRALYEKWEADPAGYDEEMRPWARFVQDEYDSVKAAQRMRGLVEEIVDGRYAEVKMDLDRGTSRNAIELLGETVEDGMTFAEMIKGVQKRAAFGKQFVGNRLMRAQSRTTYEMYQIAQLLGWKDTGLDEPVFVKEKQ